ncbi:MAG: hypothetical protein JOS17DRAFT_793030 [Linnemannia elongata]|nr:MAG: hypothetical protein JOS17DRAFT_793030 [Linnemannia elongata]
MRSTGDNNTQDDMDVQGVMNGDNQAYSNLSDDARDMDTEQVGTILLHPQTGKKNDGRCSSDIISAALNSHGGMEINVVAPYLQWDHEVHHDHGHLFQPWLPNELSTSYRITSLSQQRRLMQNEGNQILPVLAEASTRPSPPLDHSPDRSFVMVPSVSAEQTTIDPHQYQYQSQSQNQHHRRSQRQLSRQQLQQQCSMKRGQRRTNFHAKDVLIEHDSASAKQDTNSSGLISSLIEGQVLAGALNIVLAYSAPGIECLQRPPRK